MQLLCLELNEVNFDMVERYVARGELPHLARLIEQHGLSRTTSEAQYEQLEPWIQWVTVHTGLTYAQHGVFRLGDFPKSDHKQIWEHLEAQGRKVGAISPMNAANRTSSPAFFVPDPWTSTMVDANPVLTGLYRAIVQAVNENAQARITPASAIRLALGMLRYGWRLDRFLPLFAGLARGKPWRKALILDRLLAEVYVSETARHRPDFATLFLNAAAHIQHHYLFSSAAYDGALSNPDWYIDKEDDPLLEAYQLYDDIIANMQARFPKARLVILTGLHQDPDDKGNLHWRLKEPEAFLNGADVPHQSVATLMSRDFVVECRDETEAREAQARMEQLVASDDEPLFDIDNRGISLFCVLTYPRDITSDLQYGVAGEWIGALKPQVAFVAVRNGHHHGTGYWIDTGLTRQSEEFALAEVPNRLCAMLGAPPLVSN